MCAYVFPFPLQHSRRPTAELPAKRVSAAHAREAARSGARQSGVTRHDAAATASAKLSRVSLFLSFHVCMYVPWRCTLQCKRRATPRDAIPVNYSRRLHTHLGEVGRCLRVGARQAFHVMLLRSNSTPCLDSSSTITFVLRPMAMRVTCCTVSFCACFQ